MVRKKLAAAIAAIGALQAGVVSALGLGDFSLQSALNQPLQAEIRLLNTSDLDSSQVHIALASSDDFKNAGVSRDFFLTNLNFTVELDGKGGGVIKISTRESVVEPYLDFLVEARWPNGRLLREYTVLLDLPVFSESDSPHVDAAASSFAAPSEAVPAPVQTEAAVSSTRPSTSVRQTQQQGELAPGENYRVRTEDTLWEIASKSRPETGISVQKTMLGIQRLNPHAFVNGNINRLKAGSVLRLPSADELSDISDRDAVGEVASQNRAWRAGEDVAPSTSDAQLDATARTAASDSAVAAQPRLSIASGGEVDRTSAGDGMGAGAGSKALLDKLDASQENLDMTRRENQELQSRLGEMEAKMATLQRLIELKDDQLAALQGDMAEQQEQTAETESPVVETKSSVEEPAAPAKPAATPAKAKPTPAPTPTPAEAELLDTWLDNPIYAGAAGLLVLAIALLLLRRRKAAEAANDGALELEEESDNSLADIAFDADIKLNEASDDEASSSTDQLVAELEQEIAEDLTQEHGTKTAGGAHSTVQAETGDAIAEADIYVAYGRFKQAADLLRSAIAHESGRSDLQVKLLEVYLETRDKQGFQQQYQQLQALGDEDAVAAVKEMLSTVDGVADWLDNLPGTTRDFSDPDMGTDLLEAEASDDTEVLDEELEIDLDLDDLGATQELDAVALDAPEIDLDEALDLDLEGEDDDISLDKTLQLDAVSLDTDEDELTDLLAAASPDDSLDEELELELDLDEEALDLGELEDLAQQADEATETLELPEEEAVAEGFDLDLDADSDLDLDMDLEMDDLESADLSDLEAEFGDASPEKDTQKDKALAIDLSAEFDLIESPADESTSETDLDVAADLDSLLDDVDFELDAEPATEADTTLAFSSEAPAIESGDESFPKPTTAPVAEDDFDFLADSDEVATKLDLARAYIDMGDTEGAKDILEEVLQEGNETQKQEASELIARAD
jgi:pilus assembly protein FimV